MGKITVDLTAFTGKFVSKIRFEWGFSEWAEFGKLVKSYEKDILEKDDSILQDGKIGEDDYMPGMSLKTIHA